MSTMENTLKNIFLEAAKVFGKEQSEKLLIEAFPIVQKPAKEEKKKSEDKKKSEEDKSEKRIGRMTAAIANKLKAELVKVGVKFTDNEKKELDKFKKEFASYVNELTNDDFTSKGLEKHMEDFAKLNSPTSAAPVEVEKPKVESATTPISAGPSNVAHVEDLSLKELQSVEMIATPDKFVGVFWDGDKGRWIRGPEQDDDEDLTEKKFKGKTYGIGDKTGRVYELTDNKDIFVGFAGVGAFKDLKL
jgi:hypothetical protein